MLNVERPVRSITRSDGTVKIYGWTVCGDTCNIVMVKAGENYNITEIWIGGKPIKVGVYWTG